MGNRAVVSVTGSKVGVYLHWNGGLESVTAFLRASKDLGVRDPTGDTSYFYARFVQIAANYFGGTTSVGIDSLTRLDCDNGDNGLYIVGKDFKITSRKHNRDSMLDQERSDAIYAEVMAANKAIFERKE
jgi:hypothetical protein